MAHFNKEKGCKDTSKKNFWENIFSIMWNVDGCELEIPFRSLVISEDENYKKNIL